MAMGHWCDGRASLVVGTHTHVPTADTMILSGGTAPVRRLHVWRLRLGHRHGQGRALRRFISGMARDRFTPAEGEATLSGVYVETDDRSPRHARRADPRGRPACPATPDGRAAAPDPSAANRGSRVAAI